MANTCLVCVKVVLDSEEGIDCDGICRRWFHRSCMSMSKTEYLRISGNTNVEWYCTRMDYLHTPNQPLTLLTIQMAVVLSKLDDLLSKVNKIARYLGIYCGNKN